MITDALIERYLTGDLPAELKQHVEQAAAKDAALQARIASLRTEREAKVTRERTRGVRHARNSFSVLTRA